MIGTLLTENKKLMLKTRNVLILIKDKNEHKPNIPPLPTEKRKAEAKQVQHWNPACREQEADAKN